jgi:hypothetical protein
MGGYLPHINRLFVVFTHCTRSCSRNTTDSQPHEMISIVRLARSFFLGLDVTGACDVVSVTRPSPCARLPQSHYNIWCQKQLNLSKIMQKLCNALHYWLLTAVAQVQAWVRSCGICGGQSDNGAGFLRVLRFPMPINPLIIPHSSSSIIQSQYNRPNSGWCAKWTQSHRTPRK